MEMMLFWIMSVVLGILLGYWIGRGYGKDELERLRSEISKKDGEFARLRNPLSEMYRKRDELRAELEVMEKRLDAEERRKNEKWEASKKFYQQLMEEMRNIKEEKA